MTDAAMTTWQPATLPDGWRVVRVEVEMDLYTHARRTLLVELRHIYGWEFRFSTIDPTQINEEGLVQLLNALTSAETGLADVTASFDGRGMW